MTWRGQSEAARAWSQRDISALCDFARADFKSCVWPHTWVGKRNKGWTFLDLGDCTGWLDTCVVLRTHFWTNFCLNETLTLHELNSRSISPTSVVWSPPASGRCTAFWKHPLKVGWHLAQNHWAWLLSGTGFDVSWNARLASTSQAVMVVDTVPPPQTALGGFNASIGVRS